MTTRQDLGRIADKAVREILDVRAPFGSLSRDAGCTVEERPTCLVYGVADDAMDAALWLRQGSNGYTLTTWAGRRADPDMAWADERFIAECTWCRVLFERTDVLNELCADCEGEDRPADRHDLFGRLGP